MRSYSAKLKIFLWEQHRELWYHVCRTGRVQHDLRNENIRNFHWEKLFSVFPKIRYKKKMHSYAAKLKTFLWEQHL